MGQRIDQPREIVFQERFAFRAEIGDHAFVVGAVGGGKAEVPEIPGGVHRDSLQPEGDGAVLGIGERLRIAQFQAHLAAGKVLIPFKQFAHPGEIGGMDRRALAEKLGVVQPHVDGLVDGREHAARAVGKGEQLFLGQVQLPGPERHVGKHVHRQEQHGHQDQSAERQRPSVKMSQGLHGPPLSLPS